MRKNHSRRYIPKQQKAAADKRKRAMFVRFRQYKPGCLFVVGAESKLCGKPTVGSHTIPKAKVLEPMKGPDHKVLVTSWGVGEFSHLFMSSSEEDPIALSPSLFKPSPQGINSASTGQFACCDHEPNTFDPIDVAEPDFTDLEVLFLSEYRAYLYAYSRLLWGKWMYDQWYVEIMRRPNIGRRADWIKKRAAISQLMPSVGSLVSQLGKLWFERKRSANVMPQITSGKLISFRSSLKFAGCMFYGRSSAITVFPVKDEWHKIGITRLTVDEADDDGLIVKLMETANVSREEENYSIDVLTALHDVAAGVVAMAPESFELLSQGEKLRIGEIMASVANADLMADVLNSTA